MAISGVIGIASNIDSEPARNSDVSIGERHTADGRLVRMFADGPRSAVIEGIGGSLVAIHVAGGIPESGVEAVARHLLERSLTGRLNPDPREFDDTSFAIWHGPSQILHLSRSSIGVPPVFYCEERRRFMWATNMRTLIDMGASRDVNDTALAQFQMIGYVQAPMTFFRSISKLPSAHGVDFRHGVGPAERFWAPTWVPKERGSKQTQVAQLREVVAEAIEKRASQSGKTGLLLSSGIDSVGVAAVARSVLGLEVEAFTFVYEQHTMPDESALARRVCDFLEIEHHEISLDASFVARNIDSLVTDYEEPISFGIHSAKMGLVGRRDIDVLLTGAESAVWGLPLGIRAGGLVDRWSAGLSRNHLKTLASRVPDWFHDLRTILSQASMNDVERFLADPQHQLIDRGHVARLHKDPKTVETAFSQLIVSLGEALSDAGAESLEDRIAMLGLSSFGPEHLLWWSHRWAEAGEFGTAFPLLDADYIDVMARRVKRDPSKSVRRRMVAELIPEELTRTKKQPQAVPLTRWLRGGLRPLAEELLASDLLTEDRILDESAVRDCLQSHLAGASDHKWCVWTAVSYLAWKRAWEAS